MKEIYFKQFGHLFCNDYENFMSFLKDKSFFKQIKDKKHNHKDLISYESNEKYNGLSYIVKIQSNPFSETISFYSCSGDYFNSENEYSNNLNRLFSLDLKLFNICNNMRNNPLIKKAFEIMGDTSMNNAPNVLNVGDIEGLKQFFIDCDYQLGLENFHELIEDYSEHDEEILFKINFILDMYNNKKFTKKLLLGDSYHYVKCDAEGKEVFSYASDASDDYFFIFEKDIETKNIRVFFDFMSNIDKKQFKFSSCVVGKYPKIVNHYLLNETPCFISSNGNNKVEKNTQTFLFQDIDYIASSLAEHLKIKLPKIFD